MLSLLPAAALAQDARKRLSAEELEELLKDKEHVFLLDVREPKELDEDGAVKGYVNIPLGQLESRLSEIPKDKKIVALCLRGVRAGRAAALLAKNGYNVVGACGITEWKQKNKPVIYPKK